MSDLSINNRCPDCRIVLNASGTCPRCKGQVKPRDTPTKTRYKKRGISDLGTLRGEAFYAEFCRVFNVLEVKISREAMEWWDCRCAMVKVQHRLGRWCVF